MRKSFLDWFAVPAGAVRRAALRILLPLAFLLPYQALARSSTNLPPAKVKVSGYGILGNRELKRSITSLEPGKAKPAYFTASFVEDAAMIIIARVKHDGYLNPKLTAFLTLADGTELRLTALQLLENPLPQAMRVKQLRFKVQEGVLYHFSPLRFEGLQTIEEKQARSYFVDTGVLFQLHRYAIFTPDRLRRGITSLRDVLDQQGYTQATVEVAQSSTNDANGAVGISIVVRQGPKYVVENVHERFFYDKSAEPADTRTVRLNKAFSRVWTQDFIQSLKTNQFRQGYPDTTVELKTLEQLSDAGSNRIQVTLQADVKSGSKIHIGAVKFTGQKRTKESILARRVRVERGDLLDPIMVEEGRYRLARLGAFETVDVEYQVVDDQTRDVIYQIKEGKFLHISLLGGYGSYELLRGGVELRLDNLWGRAHQVRLRGIQSFKSSSGDFTYTIPEVIGRDVDLFVNASGLRREEVSFTRLEYGGGLGAHKYFNAAATDLTTRYNYQILSAEDTFPAVATEGLVDPAVGSVIADVKHDRRDNPLYPRRGYKVFSTIETATDYIGGEANYQRLEISPSVHFYLGGGRSLALGAIHAADITFGSPAHNLPFNKRFFPGGDNSIRGYKEGEASPRNSDGKIVGAESYMLGTVEFEQALTPKWSIVFFSDSLGFAQHIANYPFDTGLFSVGGGFRWRTIIGPMRLEYGYNLNPRNADPTGTLHFALGYPF